MITANEIVKCGDKLEVNNQLYILAQVSAGLFTLISLIHGNRLVDPFPCLYGLRIGAYRQSDNDETYMYGSFTIKDLKDALISRTSKGLIEDGICYNITIKQRFCYSQVYKRLVDLYNKKLEKVNNTINNTINNTGRQCTLQMPLSCKECPVEVCRIDNTYGSVICHATLWRHFCHA